MKTNQARSMRRPPKGVNVSLAACSAAYLAVFGEKHPDTMPFAKAAELVREARPEDWDQVLLYADQLSKVRTAEGRYPSHESVAAKVRELRGIGA